MEDKKMEQKEEKKEIAEEALKVIAELEESTKLEEIVKDNKIEFQVGDNFFRVRKPNVQEQEIINSERRKKYVELVDDDSYYFRKQWIKKYTKKGIDINKMESDIMKLQDKIKSLLLRLAKETSKNNIDKIKEEIEKIRQQQNDINVEKVDLMSHCIEDQLVIYGNSYTSYMVLERKEEDNWVKHFETYESYLECKDWSLLNRMYYYLNVLIYETEI